MSWMMSSALLLLLFSFLFSFFCSPPPFLAQMEDMDELYARKMREVEGRRQRRRQQEAQLEAAEGESAGVLHGGAGGVRDRVQT